MSKSESDRQRRTVGEEFRWAVGVESSCIPHLNVDQFQWTQHDKFWRDDFKRVANELGCRWLRYSVPWHTLEPQRNTFNWHWTDERFELARDLGLELILDLVHFGTPIWLPDAFGDVDFPTALESFTRAFAQQYRGAIHTVSPLNEPLISALFSGDVGLWPPHGRNLKSYTTILSRIAQGVSRSIQALRELSPDTEIMVCDALEYPSIEADAAQIAAPEVMKLVHENLTLRQHRRHIAIDLITGRVDQDHPLNSWLIKNGFPPTDLNWFVRNPVEIDVLGLDYYCHSEMELYACPDNRIRQRVPEELAGLNRAVRDYWHRYQLPMMVTETSCCGGDQERQEWLETTVGDIRKLRSEGIPLIGYTWWPLLDHLDWDGALLHQIGRIHRVGVYRLERAANGELIRTATPLTEQYRETISHGDKLAGKLCQQPKTTKKLNEAPPRKPLTTVKTQLDFPIIVHCHLRWDGVWQRPQQFLSRLSRNHKILFVEGPILVEDHQKPRSELRTLPNYPNVTVMQTFFPTSRFHEGQWVDNERLRLLEAALEGPLAGEFDRTVQWFYDPMAAPCFIGRLEESAIVYDCMDELSQFKFAPPEIVQRERQLLAAADVVFAGGRKLHQSKSRHHQNAHFYGCGVEFHHFRKARDGATVVPFDADFIHRPILGYFGVIDERLDYELIDKLAQTDPHWSIVMIGPVTKVDPNSLPNRVNIYWLGRRDYAHLPAYSKAFNVCMMPFALNEATEFINPTKALEYMAAGRPIVSSAVPDVVSNFGDVVKIASSHEHFVELCRLALDAPEQFPVERGLEMAEQNSWEATVEKLEKHIHDVLRHKTARRHTTKVQEPKPNLGKAQHV